MTAVESFKNSLPKSHLKKNIFILFFSGIFTITPLFFFSDLHTYPNIPSDIPTVNISFTDKLSIKRYADCVFNLDNDPISGKIRIRGATSATRDKLGYRIELSNQKSLLGMREDDDWVLFGMHQDYSRMRYKLSFDLWNEIQEKDSEVIMPKSRFVNLVINGKFQGLYLLTEKNDRRLSGLDDAIDDIDSSLIFQAKRKADFSEYDDFYWEQDWPNEDEGIYIMEDILSDLTSFINDVDNETFFDDENGIYSKFDKDNLIDFFIFNFFTLHKDFWNKNYFIVRNTDPNLFKLMPWDYDYSFGQWQSKMSSHDSSIMSYIRNRNFLYETLTRNQEFMEDCKNRWEQLREDVFTEDFILDMISDMYEEVKESLEIDMNMWEPDVDYKELVDYLYEWVPDRIEYCDSFFDEY